MDSDDAARLAEKMLAAELPRRWRHVRSVARRARWTAKQLSLSEDLVAAAWLHDIGYASDLVETGFTRWMGRAISVALALMGRS
jgi:HD superfamily phosphodiesterase